MKSKTFELIKNFLRKQRKKKPTLCFVREDVVDALLFLSAIEGILSKEFEIFLRSYEFFYSISNFSPYFLHVNDIGI